MQNNDFFDSSYVGQTETTSTRKRSEVKQFLREPINEEEIKKYGTSKPKRIVIRAKITNG